MSTSRDEKVAEGRRLLELARYSEALALFEQAEQQHNDLELALDVSRLLLMMGLRGRACEKIGYALDRFPSTEHDKHLLAHARLFQSLNTIMETARGSEALQVAIGVYNEVLDAKPVQDYTQRMVLIEASYSVIFDALGYLGYQAQSAPRTSIEKLRDLFRHCLVRKWFEAAASIAGVYSDYYLVEDGCRMLASPDVERGSLYEELLSESSLPDLVRAEFLIRLSKILVEDDKNELAKEKIQEAKGLFEKKGHVCGVLSIELERLKSPSPTHSPSTRMSRIREIKSSFEAVSNWNSVMMTVRYMYKIAAAEMFDSKLVESLYQESLEIPGNSPGSIVWIIWQEAAFRTLQWFGANTGRSLASIEALYDSLDESEAPLLRENSAILLCQINESLGNKAEATKWQSRVRNPAKFSMLLEDPFKRRLETATSFPELDEEKALLTQAMQQLTRQTSDQVPLTQRHSAAMSMCHIAELYLNQVRLRGIDATRELVNYCFQQVKLVLPRIMASERPKCTGVMLQNKARLLQVEALFGPPDFEAKLAMLRQATIAHEEVLRYYQSVDLSLEAGFASTQLAICHQILWGGTGSSPDSLSFHAAAKLFEEAGTLLQRHGAIPSYRKNTRMCLGLWFECYKARLRTPQGFLASWVSWLGSWVGMRASSPLQMTKHYLEQLEQAIDRQRHDLSFLSTEQAIIAKQAMRNDEDMRSLYDTAIPFYGLQNDLGLVWRSVQKSKARSVSDLLGLGVVVPEKLATRIDTDGEAKALLEREQQMLVAVERDATDAQYSLRKKLDAHRDAMRRNPSLQEVLELREGVPVTISRLRALGEILKAQGSQRRIIFIDYFITAGNIWLAAVLPDSIPFFDLKVTAHQMSEWKQRHPQFTHPLHDDDDSDDDDSSFLALQELSPLIKPLAEISQEGDLLVLCASGPLHAIPLHAAPLPNQAVANDSRKTSLINRNPIVYCPSMTVFEQCAARAHAAATTTTTSQSAATRSGGQSLLAVYETPPPDDLGGSYWQTQRADSYATFRDLAAEIDGARLFTGAEVDGPRFRAECEGARIVHFLGHCGKGAEDSTQHLVLAAAPPPPIPTIITSPPPPSPPLPQPRSPAEETATLVPISPFTVSHLFDTRVRAAHFNLIACASASQVIGQGDEPWGIVTALLCAGATSVGGTMWPIQVGTGERFMRLLYKGEEGLRADGGGGFVDLAVAHQKVVKRLKRAPDTRGPGHWAAFVLHGAWFYGG